MASVLEDLPRGSRVAILRLRSLGDCVLTTPALHLLKRARPDLRIAVMVEDRFRAIFENNPDLEAILPAALRPLRSWRPRLCLNLHGGSRSAWLTALSGAQWRAGYAHFRHRFLYNARIPRAQQILGVERTVHTAEHAASAIFWLGVTLAEIPRAALFTAPSEPRASASGRAPVAVIHPVAATPAKTWRPDGFLAVAAHLKHAGIDPVFIGAASDDLSAFAAYTTLRGAPLSEIKHLLSTASLFVGNDSGPAHMAAAFGVPVVVLFGESNPAIWGPWRTASEVLTTEAEPAQVLDAVARLGVQA
ncbi:MAG: glycosyltransferase family 9 protein [Candidatus Sulfopaludibacter sp.]|nr:glycosyltransferase family 9 protein [Candidatus Sulfopaludibacter sp.]